MKITEIELNRLIKRAVKILRKNYSCPGSDGISYKMFKMEPSYHRTIAKLMYEEFIYGERQFSSPKEVIIIDAHKKERLIFVYNIYDRIVQQCLKLQIEHICQKGISESVLSHKRKLNVEQAYFSFYNSTSPQKNILNFDVKDFYRSINKNILFASLAKIGIESNLIIGISKSFQHCESGIPVGNCLSPILSDLYLQPIDNAIYRPFIRFSDDFAVKLSDDDDVMVFMKKMEHELGKIALQINTSKLKLNGVQFEMSF